MEKPKKLTYLVIKWWTVSKVNNNNWFFKKQENNKMIYEWDGFRIYDDHKTKALPIVKMLFEEFKPVKNTISWINLVLLILVLCFIFIYSPEDQKNYDPQLNKILSSIDSKKLNEKKDISNTKISKNSEWKFIRSTEENLIQNSEENNENNKSELIALNNENEGNKMTIEWLEKRNLALEIEKEKYKIQATSKINELAIYQEIKKEFYDTQKEEISKNLKLEFFEIAKQNCRDQTIKNIKFLCQKYN